MNVRTRTQLLALFAAGTVLVAAGCDQRNDTATTSSVTPPPSTATAPMTPTDQATAAASNAGERVAAATEAAGDKMGDAAITAKVKTALMAEPGIRSLEINVDTRDNNVTLAGTVPSAEVKVRAMQIAQGVEGVRSVSDQLVVKPS